MKSYEYAPSNPQIIAKLQRLSRVAATVVFAVGCLVIVGWLFNIEIMKSVLPSLATMKFNTALGFVLAGGGLLSLYRQERIAQILAITVLLLGLFTLSEYIFTWNLDIDQWLIRDTVSIQNLYPGRMSPVTALNFCLIGGSLLLIARFRILGLGQLLALAATFTALISLAGYIYAVRSLYQFSIFSSMTLHTTTAFIALGLGIIFAYPGQGLTGVIVTDRAGGLLIRRLLPAALLIPLLLGWLGLKGQEAGLYDTNFGLALFAVCNVSVFTLLVFWNARSLNHMEIERNQAMIALRYLNDQLEGRVQERTAELIEANQGLKQEIIERKRSQTLYQTLVEHLPDTAVIMFDHEMQYTIADGPILATTGYSQDQMLGKTMFEVLPLESQKVLLPLYQRALQGETFQFEREFANMHYTSRFLPVYDLNDRITNGLIVVQDITERKQAENALREAENLFRALLESAPDAIIIVNTEDEITLINAQTEKFFGYIRAELLGKPIEMLIPGLFNGLAHRTQYVTESHIRSMDVGLELYAVRKDGSRFPVEISLSPIETAEGILISSAIRDITERKLAEAALRANEEKLRTIFDLLPVGASLLDSNKQIVQINRALERILDINLPDLLNGTYQHRRYIHGDGSPMLANDFPSERAMIEQKSIYDVEIGVIIEEGETIWTSVSAAPLLNNQGVVIVTVDISESKRVKEALKTSLEEEKDFQNRLKSLHEITNELMLVDDMDEFYKRAVALGLKRLGHDRLGLLLFNKEENRVVGTYGTDTQGRLVAEHHIRFDPAQLTSILGRSLHDEKRFVLDENAQLYSNFEPIGMGWNAVAVLSNGIASTGWLTADNAVNHRPVTQSMLDILSLYAMTLGAILVKKQTHSILEKTNSQLQLANEEVQRFAYIVSHDLRAPLINLKGFSALLQTSVDQIDQLSKSMLPLLDDTQRNIWNTTIREKVPLALRFINTSVDRMDGFTTAILKLSRLGNHPLHYENIILKDLIDRILQSLAAQIEERQIEIVIEELPDIQADRIALDQIMGNIIGNAINYLDPHRIGRIRIYGEHDKQKTTIHVEDNGRGIAEVDYEKIFAPFRRAGPPTVEGEGMGLAYVQALVKRHQGQIQFTSIPDVVRLFRSQFLIRERKNHNLT